MSGATIAHGDCIEVMRGWDDASVDAIVTDPPYGLGLMGKKWDDLPPGQEWAEECLRVLKPGGYLLAFGGTRTWHRLAVVVEDAGFEIRDSIAWMYSSGFPKSLNVSKAIDRAAGKLAPESTGFTVAGYSHAPDKLQHTAPSRGYVPPAPATEDARTWQGWGTALKPAFEPVVVARKPLAGTVAANVLAHGTGALNIDGARIGDTFKPADAGRWPANVILDESQAAALDKQSGTETSRFFYCSKAPKRERPEVDGVKHPTVKPLSLMRHLVRLVTPPGGVVVDPFAGSGATVEAALLEGFGVVGIEREADYLPLIEQRIARAAGALAGKESA